MDGILPAHFAWFWAGCPLATRLSWLHSLGFNISCNFLGLDGTAVVFLLLFGNEHNALGQGLMLGLNWLRFAWFLHWSTLLGFGLAAFWSLFG